MQRVLFDWRTSICLMLYRQALNPEVRCLDLNRTACRPFPFEHLPPSPSNSARLAPLSLSTSEPMGNENPNVGATCCSTLTSSTFVASSSASTSGVLERATTQQQRQGISLLPSSSSSSSSSKNAPALSLKRKVKRKGSSNANIDCNANVPTSNSNSCGTAAPSDSSCLRSENNSNSRAVVAWYMLSLQKQFASYSTFSYLHIRRIKHLWNLGSYFAIVSTRTYLCRIIYYRLSLIQKVIDLYFSLSLSLSLASQCPPHGMRTSMYK